MFFFGAKTVNSIIASFTRTVADLRKVAERHQKDAESCHTIAVEASQKAAFNESETVRALRIADKIEALVSD